MANDTVSINNPVKVVSDSPQRVAYDLMQLISSREEKNDEEKQTRAYWLTLFHQCMKAAKGHSSLESILQADQGT